MAILLPFSTIDLTDYDLNLVGVNACGAYPREVLSIIPSVAEVAAPLGKDSELVVGDLLDYQENGIEFGIMVVSQSRLRETTPEIALELALKVRRLVDLYRCKSISISWLFVQRLAKKQGYVDQITNIFIDNLPIGTRIDFYGSK